jgi:hypothetical protein
MPVTFPKSSTTTTWMPSPFPFLSREYAFDDGFGAMDFQKTVLFVRPRVCWSYQSVTVAGVYGTVAETPVYKVN